MRHAFCFCASHPVIQEEDPVKKSSAITRCLLFVLILSVYSPRICYSNPIIPGPTYLLNIDFTWINNPVNGNKIPLTTNSTSISATGGYAGVSLQSAPSATAYINDPNGIGNAGGSWRAQSQLTYYFSVIGPQDVIIPILIDYKIIVSSTGSIYSNNPYYNAIVQSSAGISVHGYGDLDSVHYISNYSTIDQVTGNPFNVDTGGTYTGTLAVDVMTNNVGTGNEISLSASVGGSNYSGYYHGLMQGLAYVDPVIRIDPSFANAPLYSIVLSPGAGNTWGNPAAATPEPASMLLMGIGAAGVAFMKRRKVKAGM